MVSLYIFSESRAAYEKLTQSFLSEKLEWMSESFMVDFFFHVVLEPSKSEDYTSPYANYFHLFAVHSLLNWVVCCR